MSRTLGVDTLATQDGSHVIQVQELEGAAEQAVRSAADRDLGNATGQLAASTIELPFYASSGSLTLSNWIAGLGVVHANQYGFSADTGTADGNRDAIVAAVNAAGGRRVIVAAAQDFQMSTVTVGNIDFDFEVIGGGYLDRTAGGGPAVVVENDYTDLMTCSLSKDDGVILNGTSTDGVTTANVSDSSAYARGDIVKVFSDDIDPDASSSQERRIGEFATVVGVVSGKVYLDDSLYHYNQFSTNIRVARFPKFKQRFWINVRSREENDYHMYYMRAGHFPEVHSEVLDHGQVVFNSAGSYQGSFHLRGNGFGKSDGTLSYLFNDSNGFRNTVYEPVGSYFRHVTTTNFYSTTAGMPNPERYGGTVGHTVVRGIAAGCQGIPWDDHEGARGTRWLDCEAYGSVDNSATQRNAFGCRGRDEQIINPKVYGPFERMCTIGDYTKGTLTIVNPSSSVPLFDDRSSSPNDDFIIQVHGGHSTASGEARAFGESFKSHSELYNHTCYYTFTDRNDTSIIRPAATGQKLTMLGGGFVVVRSGSGLRPRFVSDDSVAAHLNIKDVVFRVAGGTGYQDIVYGRGSAAYAAISFSVEGLTPADLAGAAAGGSFGSNFKYQIRFTDNPSDGVSNLSNFEEYIQYM